MAFRPFANWIFGSHFFDVSFGVVVGAAISMALAAEPKDISRSLWIFTVAAALAALRAGHWIITDSLLPLPRWVMAFLLFGGIGVVWYLAYAWVEKKLDLTPWFGGEVRSALLSDTGPRTMYMIRYPSSFGDTVSPLLYLAYIQIVNNDDTPRTVNELAIAVSKDPDGPWEDLKYISLESATVIYPSVALPASLPVRLILSNGTYRFATVPPEDGMKTARVTVLGPKFLHDELNKPLMPHEPISGWIGLDSLRHQSLTPGDVYFRLSLHYGVAKKDSKLVMKLPRNYENMKMDVNCGEIRDTGIIVDASQSHLKYYSDPFPPPEFIKR